jgi:hypothetical protein
VTFRTSSGAWRGEGYLGNKQTQEIPMHDTTTRPGAMLYVGVAAVLLMLYLI